MDQWVRIAYRPLAEKALHNVFGEDIARGPLIATPASLLSLSRQWPAARDAVLKVALETPADFDIERELGKDERKALVLVLSRVTVYAEQDQWPLGYGLRTDQLGINAIATYWEMVEAHRRKLRQAH